MIANKDDDPAGNFHAVVDRIEDGDIAVLLIGDAESDRLDLPVTYLPDGASDGDHLRISIRLDNESRKRAEEEVRRLQDELQSSVVSSTKEFKL